MDEKSKEDVENLEVEPLQDADLDAVAGGTFNLNSSVGTGCCGNNNGS